jgi:hypothetical protein
VEGRDVGQLNEGAKVYVTSTAGNLLSGRSKIARRISWRCCSFARLRYSSEGGALVIRGGLLAGIPEQQKTSPSSIKRE